MIAVLGVLVLLVVRAMVAAGPLPPSLPLAHGAYSVNGVGIHGPPAVTYKIRLDGPGSSGGAIVPAPTSTPSADALVDTFVVNINGITGRRARQLALAVQAKQDSLARIAKVYGPAATRTASSAASAASATASVSTAPASVSRGEIVVISNQPDYTPSSVRHDLHVVRKWAGDLGQLSTTALMNETVAAILSAAARYYPEVSTRAAARAIIADIKAESDFNPTLVSGPRLDSGSSWGLMQVSPLGSSRELELFKSHARVNGSSYTWGPSPNLGPLLDWKTGKKIDLTALTNDDLFRPWINIHVASWIQSNLARTSSQDPYSWTAIAAAAVTGTSTGDRLTNLLAGAKLPRSLETGFGSWVAGPSVNGNSGYARSGDDVSTSYFNNINSALNVLYNSTLPSSWLDTLTLTPGLVDYR